MTTSRQIVRSAASGKRGVVVVAQNSDLTAKSSEGLVQLCAFAPEPVKPR